MRTDFKVYRKIDVYWNAGYLWSTCAFKTLKAAKADALQRMREAGPRLAARLRTSQQENKVTAHFSK